MNLLKGSGNGIGRWERIESWATFRFGSALNHVIGFDKVSNSAPAYKNLVEKALDKPENEMFYFGTIKIFSRLFFIVY